MASDLRWSWQLLQKFLWSWGLTFPNWSFFFDNRQSDSQEFLCFKELVIYWRRWRPCISHWVSWNLLLLLVASSRWQSWKSLHNGFEDRKKEEGIRLEKRWVVCQQRREEQQRNREGLGLRIEESIGVGINSQERKEWLTLLSNFLLPAVTVCQAQRPGTRYWSTRMGQTFQTARETRPPNAQWGEQFSIKVKALPASAHISLGAPDLWK